VYILDLDQPPPPAIDGWIHGGFRNRSHVYYRGRC
jgi:hypothetical protein